MENSLKKISIKKSSTALLCLLAWQCAAVAADMSLDQAQGLVNGKKFVEAYAILAPLQSERAGESDYDYLLAIAALDSGKAAEAVFALERFLLINPNHGPARLELARAYYAMGDIKASRLEFETVKRQKIPSQVNEAIQNYLSAMNAIAANEGTRVRGYVELGGGHDGNANSATSATQVAIPMFGGAIATLDSASRSQSDNFVTGGAGISVRHPMSAAWAFNSSASFNSRRYKDVSQFNLANIDGSAGLTRTIGVAQLTAALQYQKIYLDDSSYRQTYGVLGQWQHNIDEQHQITAYGQAMQVDYSGTQQIRDASRYLLGAAYSQAITAKYLPVAYVGAYLGQERPDAGNVPHLGNNFVGLRAGGQLTLSASLALVGSASVEHRDYRGDEPGFLRKRADRQHDVSLALVYMPKKDWVVRPEINYIRSNSNIVFNDFSRTQYLVTVRRNFN
jgi:tetratricopeptide (TPR) repeat protein